MIVAAFDPDTDLQNPDFRLMINTFATMFWRQSLLDETATRLESSGYHIIRIDAGSWETENDLHDAVSRTLDFPGYYGRNLDAFNDCLGDVVDGEYGWDATSAGLVLVFTSYHEFARRCPRAAQTVLDIVASQARSALLFGRRVMCLVQTDDPELRFEPVGAVPVMWNDAEWLDSKRRQDN